MKKIKTFAMFALHLMVVLFAIKADAASGRWIKDSATGCEMFVGTKHPDGMVRWSGQCNNGKAEGYGRIQYLLDGREYFAADLAEGTGLSFSAGRIKFNINEVPVKLFCARPTLKEGGKRVLNITQRPVKEPPWIFDEMRDAAGNYVLAKCPITPQPYDFRGIEISVVLADGTSLIKWEGAGNAFKKDEISWGKTSLGRELYDADNRSNQIIAQVNQDRAKKQAQTQAEVARKQAEVAQRQRAEAKERAAAEKAARDSKTMSLSERYGVKAGWIPWDQVRANVFAHEGKIYLVNTQFQQMLARDTGLFGNGLAPEVMVTGLPATAFTESGKWVVLVAKILEPDASKIKSIRSTPSLQMKYLGHEFCAKPTCDDFGSFTPR